MSTSDHPVLNKDCAYLPTYDVDIIVIGIVPMARPNLPEHFFKSDARQQGGVIVGTWQVILTIPPTSYNLQTS